MEQLRKHLEEMEGQGYKAYKRLEGRYRFPDFTLFIDHVQGDPYAEASRIRVWLPAEIAGFEGVDFATPERRIALEDFLGRAVATAIQREVKGARGTGHSGQISIARHGQQVLRRSAVVVDATGIEVRLRCALPADGRRIRARDAAAMLLEELPAVVRDGLLLGDLSREALVRHLDSVEDQVALRAWLSSEGMVAFIADGALLPRRSGVDDRPLEEEVIAFQSPDALRREVSLPHAGTITGMGIPVGVTLIVGGGFHGKSTLLHALERGVYDHLPGDGRERVVSDPSAVKIRSEDGRAVAAVDISSFINNLPFGRDTRRFTTMNASGSTSQAANIVEALACGCRLMLVDEDTSATNFMIRDERMQALVSHDKEPITPLVRRVRELYERAGVSSVIVMGGTGDYFSVADTVIMMDHYQPSDVTVAAKRLAPGRAAGGSGPSLSELKPEAPRCIGRSLAQAIGTMERGDRDRYKVRVRDERALSCGTATIDLSCVEQVVDGGQLLAIGYLLHRVAAQSLDGEVELVAAVSALLAIIDDKGLDQLTPYVQGELVVPRLYEVVAAINRLRGIEMSGCDEL